MIIPEVCNTLFGGKSIFYICDELYNLQSFSAILNVNVRVFLIVESIRYIDIVTLGDVEEGIGETFLM